METATHNFKVGQIVKDQWGKKVEIIAGCESWSCAIVTTKGNYHPTKLFAI
jgi:hypothetical protein